MRDIHKDLVALFESDDFWTISRNRVLRSLITKGPVLDAGGGVGSLAKELVSAGFEVWLSDVDPRSCEYAVKNKVARKERVFPWDLTKKPSKRGMPKFGTIVLADVIEHIDEDSKVIRNCKSLLKKGGELVISVPHDQGLWSVNDVSRGHKRRYNAERIKKLLNDNNIKIKSIKFRNMLVVAGIIISKIFGFRIPHEAVSKSWLNEILKQYLINIEDRIPLPYGSEIIIIGTK